MRIGHGYDVHRLAGGRKLILGGVEIPYEKGLMGHSDADVLVHAVIDALLGAEARGDIGMLFPDSDESFKGISSIELLKRAGGTAGGIVNIDCTVIAQSPRLGPYRQAMRENIARALGLDVSRVSVKFTTEEGLGVSGQGDGMAAHAVCLID